MSALKPRTASVVIYQGDDIEALSDLKRAVNVSERQHAEARKRAEENSTARIGDDTLAEVTAAAEVVREKQAAFDEYVEKAADRAVVVEVTALSRKRFRDLMAEHQQREGNEEDTDYGVNMDSFPDPFLRESVTKVEVGERVLSPGETNELVESLAEGDFERVFASAYYLNRAPGADPRDGRYSSAPRSSDET